MNCTVLVDVAPQCIHPYIHMFGKIVKNSDFVFILVIR